MQKISTTKKMRAIKLYLEGLSFDQIAAKAGISKGTTSNIISEFRAGAYPEVSDTPELLDALRELAQDLKQSGLTPVQASIGMRFLKQVQELGVEPAEIDSIIQVYRKLTNETVDMPVFIHAAMTLDEVHRRTGLGIEELEAKAKKLEKQAGRLEPLTEQAEDVECSLDILSQKSFELKFEVAGLEKRENTLAESIRHKEQREAELSQRTTNLEGQFYSARELLASAKKDLEKLCQIGISLDNLTGLVERIKEIAHRHQVDPEEFNNWLLKCLEQADKLSGLWHLVKQVKSDLKSKQEQIDEAKRGIDALDSTIVLLKKERTSLEAAMEREKKHLSQDMKAIRSTAENAVAELRDKLSAGIDQGLEEVSRLKAQAIELGIEQGQFRVLIESNQWLRALLSLIDGKNDISVNEVRVIGSQVLRSISDFIALHHESQGYVLPVRQNLDNALRSLEQWKPRLPATTS